MHAHPQREEISARIDDELERWPPAAPDDAEPDDSGERLLEEPPIDQIRSRSFDELWPGIESCLRIIASADVDKIEHVFRNQAQEAIRIAWLGDLEKSTVYELGIAGERCGLTEKFIEAEISHAIALVRSPPASEPEGLEPQFSTENSAISAQNFVLQDPRSLPRRDRLYGTHLYRGYVSATVAPGGLGKSSLAIVEVLAMSTGKPLLGQRSYSRPLRGWLWNLEDPAEELARRIGAACLHHGITETDLSGRLFVNGREHALVIAQQSSNGAIIVEPVVDQLVAEILAKQIDVLIVDPFVSSHRVPENDNGQIDAVVKEWGKVAGRAHCAIELVHHSRKLGSEAEVTADSARGASALTAGCRDVRVLNRMNEAEGAKAGVKNHRLYFRVYSDKQNMAPPTDGSDWYKLASVDLENGPPGQSDLVQAVERWEWPNPLDGMSAADLFNVQKRIASGEWREDAQAAKWAGQAVAELLELDLDRVEQKARVKALVKLWIESGALKVVERLDAKRRERKFIEVGQWAT
jgi:AAA domain-containing protein